MKMKLTGALILTLLIQTNIFSQVPTGQSLTMAFQDYFKADNGKYYTGSAFPVFMEKDDTKGSRYLFDKWAKGSVVGVDGVPYDCTKLLFNYDKFDEKLLVLVDSSKVLGLNSGDIGGFSLMENDSIYHFERLKNSTDMNFYQPIYKDEKGYSFYKLLKTKFNKADYHTNGIIEAGNKYDEYVDEEEYFLMKKQELIKISFKKKAIEKALEGESSKVQSFFEKHNKENINEDFVTRLVQFLNSN